MRLGKHFSIKDLKIATLEELVGGYCRVSSSRDGIIRLYNRDRPTLAEGQCSVRISSGSIVGFSDPNGECIKTNWYSNSSSKQANTTWNITPALLARAFEEAGVQLEQDLVCEND